MKPDLLVLLPGLLCDGTVWAEQCTALAPQAHCVVADLGPGTTLSAMAGSVLSATTGDDLSVAGHSMGGRVALEMMRLAPHRVRRLALLDTGYQPVPTGEAGQREREGRMALLKLAREQGMRAMGRVWASGMVLDDHLQTPMFDRILDMVERSTPDRFAAQLEALLSRPDAEPLLETIACPTLIACGRDDRWSPLSRHEMMQQRIPGSKLVVVENAGHMSTMEQPSAVSDALADWLTWPSAGLPAMAVSTREPGTAWYPWIR